MQKRKEKGKIELKNVYVIETAVLPIEDCNLTDGYGYAFQICYGESSQIYTLYLKATKEQDRTEWINALRLGEYKFPIKVSDGWGLIFSFAVCRNLSTKPNTHYHEGVWNSKLGWSCCRGLNRIVHGCKATTSWEPIEDKIQNNNPRTSSQLLSRK